MLEGYSSPIELGNSAPTSPRFDPKSLSTNAKISLETLKENYITTTNAFTFEKKINTNTLSIEEEKSNETGKETKLVIEQKEVQMRPKEASEPEESKNNISLIEANAINLKNFDETELKKLEALVSFNETSDKEPKMLLVAEDNEECNLKADKPSLDLEQTIRDKIYRKFSCDAFLQGESKIKICKESDLELDCNVPNFFNLRKIELSNCWNAISKAKERLEEIFMENKINKEEFFKDPWKILTSNNLAIRYGNHVYTWKVMAPIIMSNLCYGQDLPQDILTSLTQQEQGYLFWKRKNQDAFKIDILNQPINNSDLNININSNFNVKNSSNSVFPISNNIINISTASFSLNNIEKNLSGKLNLEGITDTISNSPTKSIGSKSNNDGKIVITTDKDKNTLTINETSIRRLSIQYKKTYTLSSDQVKLLNLKEGKNEISFVVTNKYQGETKLTTEIYLWNYNDKIIISDLDGTITKSDVLGQVFPIFGKDWSHKGVVKLYNNVVKNGYKILYLTARALCQSDQTKNYLNKLLQGILFI
jgi:PKD repeat protein